MNKHTDRLRAALVAVRNGTGYGLALDAIAAHSRIRAGMRKCANVAWVSAAATMGPQALRYRININTASREFPKAAMFIPLDGLTFDNFKAAQTIANAVRAHLSGADA